MYLSSRGRLPSFDRILSLSLSLSLSICKPIIRRLGKGSCFHLSGGFWKIWSRSYARSSTERRFLCTLSVRRIPVFSVFYVLAKKEMWWKLAVLGIWQKCDVRLGCRQKGYPRSSGKENKKYWRRKVLLIVSEACGSVLISPEKKKERHKGGRKGGELEEKIPRGTKWYTM